MTHTVPEGQEKEVGRKDSGRILAFDLGAKRIGVAVTDELQISVRILPNMQRTNWKQLLRNIQELLHSLDAKMLVIGLPLRLDGSVGTAAHEAMRITGNLSLSLNVPVYLQDERLTTRDVEEYLSANGLDSNEIAERVDGEAAALILRDFLAQLQS